MDGILIIKVPKLCECVIEINGQKIKIGITNKTFQLQKGVYNINIGVVFYDTAGVAIDDHRHSSWSDVDWAFEQPQQVTIDDRVTIIKIKRKWHLLRPITAEAEIYKK